MPIINVEVHIIIFKGFFHTSVDLQFNNYKTHPEMTNLLKNLHHLELIKL